jgi:hypothetical protein
LAGFDQHGEIPGAAMTETKIITDDQIANAQSAHQQILNEAFRGQFRQPMVKFQAQHSLNAQPIQRQQFLSQAHEPGGGSRRAGKEFLWLRLKSNHQSGQVQSPGRFGQLGENRLMTEVRPIEIADGGDTAVMAGTKIMLTADKFHAVRAVSKFAK